MSPTQHLQKPIYTNLLTQHPPFGLPYERIVPPTDATILDQFLPAGTIIGMSPWATHRDASTFGPDASAWRPERWLEGSSHTRRQMENALLTFGAGNRSCIGKHISYLEISKLVPSLVRRYKVRNDLHFPPFPFPFHKSRRSGGEKTKTTRVQTPPPPPGFQCIPQIFIRRTQPTNITTKNSIQISFADPDGNGRDWKVENRWFTKQTGLNVRLQKAG